MSNTTEKLYAVRTFENEDDGICQLYQKHLAAMTAEGLCEKSQIAWELAWRDAELMKARQIADDVVGEARLLYDMEEYPGKIDLIKDLKESELDGQIKTSAVIQLAERSSADKALIRELVEALESFQCCCPGEDVSDIDFSKLSSAIPIMASVLDKAKEYTK